MHRDAAPPPLQRLIVDRAGGTITEQTDDGGERTVDLGSPEAMSLVGDLFLRTAWDTKYVYSFSWLGRPIIQFPEDLMRLQEVVYAVRPDVIVETGIAHGGSLVFNATLCAAMGKGRVIGVDIEIRPHNRRAIEEHELFRLITLVEGDSIAPDTVDRVRALIEPGETVLVILDAKHTKDHVLAELEAYAGLVTPGSYVVAADGIMEQLDGAPRTGADWGWNNPAEAAREFVVGHPEFVIEEPVFPFNEGAVAERVTFWPDGFLRRVS